MLKLIGKKKIMQFYAPKVSLSGPMLKIFLNCITPSGRLREGAHQCGVSGRNAFKNIIYGPGHINSFFVQNDCAIIHVHYNSFTSKPSSTDN